MLVTQHIPSCVNMLVKKYLVNIRGESPNISESSGAGGGGGVSVAMEAYY